MATEDSWVPPEKCINARFCNEDGDAKGKAHSVGKVRFNPWGLPIAYRILCGTHSSHGVEETDDPVDCGHCLALRKVPD